MIRRKLNFKCSRCGECCKRIPSGYDYLDRGDGTCKYFDDETCLCSIYDHRPEVCNVELMASQSGMSRLDFFKACSDACKFFQSHPK